MSKTLSLIAHRLKSVSWRYLIPRSSIISASEILSMTSLVMLLALQGCGSSGDTAQQTILGKAYVDTPIKGATLKVFDQNGNLLVKQDAATGADGQFSVPITGPVPSALRVEVSGGMRDTKASDMILAAEMRNFRADRDIVYVNAATTVLAAALARKSQASFTDTVAAVINYFKLPEGSDLGKDPSNPAFSYFSHQTFMSLAANEGGFNSFVALLANDVVNGVASTRNFRSHSLQGFFDFSWSDVGDFAKTIGRAAGVAIGSEALGPIGGALAGMGFDAILGTGGGNSDISNQQALDVTVQLYQKLDTRLTNVATEISGVKTSIASLEDSMQKKFGLEAYNTKASALLTAVSEIQALQTRYFFLLQNPATPNAKENIDSLIAQIKNNVPVNLQTIHNGMMDSPGLGDGAITLWHQIVVNNNRNGENGGNLYPYIVNSLYAEQLNAQFEYFQIVQLLGINLLVDAYNHERNQEAAKYFYNIYASQLDAQQNAVATPRISNNVLISPINGLMWTKQLLQSAEEPICSECDAKTSPDLFAAYKAIHDDWLANRRTIWFNNGASAALNTQLNALASTTGYSDWRLPTGEELMGLGPTGGFRTVSGLTSSGFDLKFGPAEQRQTFPYLYLLGTGINPATNQNVYVSLSSGYVQIGTNQIPTGVSVLAVRPHKKDPLAVSK